MTPVWRRNSCSRHLPLTASKLKVGKHVQSHTAICNNHAPPTSTNARPFFTSLHTAAAVSTSSSACRAPSRAVLTGTTAPLTTIATTTTTDIPNDMTTATMNHATGAATTDMTTDTPNAMTTDTTTATQSHPTARGGIATIPLPPTQMNHTTRDDAPTHLHPAVLERASRPAGKRRRKIPSSTTWAKLPSLLA